MKLSRSIYSNCIHSSLLLLVWLVVLAGAVAQEAEFSAKIYSVKGSVEYRENSEGKWQPVTRGSTLKQGWEVRTLAGARLGLKFSTGKLLRLRENSYLIIQASPTAKSGGEVNLIGGVMHLFSREGRESPTVSTRDVSAAIRGTEVVFEVGEHETKVAVLDGRVELTNEAGRADVARGEVGAVAKGRAPVVTKLVKSGSMVQWAVFFPPILSFKDFSPAFGDNSAPWSKFLDGGCVGSCFTGDATGDHFGRALENYKGGDGVQAALLLEPLAATSPEARAALAMIHLQLGRVEEARRAAETLTVSHDGQSNRGAVSLGHSILSLIELSESRVGQAYARSVSETAEGDDAPLLAYWVRSWVHQSHGEMDTARKWIKKGLKVEPDNAYLLARLAELQLGFGDRHGARKNINRALAQGNANSYVLSVAGFTDLIEEKVDAAMSKFNRAAAIEPEDGLPRFGLGLGLIRAGKMSEGREQLQYAAHLEPSRSLYRSYLGKAFFSSELEELANDEFARAMELDNDDPTPYLYRAFNKLAENEVVGALNDIEDSVARNNNRAVYRSRMMLDDDSSVRSTSLAEVYQQLGFSRLSQLEAMRSIQIDYTNYGAHRLLSQSYQGDFFANTQFTQNRIADLLSPLSFNVFQGLLGYSTDSSLNEYTAMFDCDEHRTGIGAVYQTASSDARANVFQVGKSGDFGYYTGYKTEYARGRKNGGVFSRLHRFDIAGQYQMNRDNRLISSVQISQNDAQERAFGDEMDDFALSLGSHHTPFAGLDILTRFEVFNRNFDGFDRDAGRQLQEQLSIDSIVQQLGNSVVTVDQRAGIDTRQINYGAQVIRDYGKFSWVMGSDLTHSSDESEERSRVTDNPSQIFQGPAAILSSTSDIDTFSHSSYLYSQWQAASWLDLTLGANFAQVEMPGYDVIPPYVAGTRDRSLLSPKAGFTMFLNDELSVRGAYFKTLGNPSDITNGGIEPTLVGSFSQRFGDLPGVETENFGIGIDLKQPKEFYSGVEYIYRDIARDRVDTITQQTYDNDNLVENTNFLSQVADDNEAEHIIRGYWYHILTEKWVATLDATRWDLEDVTLASTNISNRVAAAVRYFDTAQWFGDVTAAWRRQDLNNRIGFDNGRESFWTVDTGVGYRLEDRHGAVQLRLRNLLDETFQFEDRGRENPIFSGFNAALEFSINF